MTPDTKTTLRSVAGLSAVIVATATGLYVTTNQILPPVPTVTLMMPDHKRIFWNDTAHAWERYRISEVEGTTNFRNWYSVTNTRGSRVAVPATKPAEFFRIHNHYTNVSGW